MIQRSINANLASYPSKDRPFIQKYSSHPFLDVECNKGLAFDSILSQLAEKERGGNVMALATQKMIILPLENQIPQSEYVLIQD
ncbi:MAG: hypothetical protein ACR2IS_06850 [Nitrososphaeraceae archaeon]